MRSRLSCIAQQRRLFCSQKVTGSFRMNKSESKYFNTAVKMDEAFLKLLEKKDFAYITVKEICEKAGVHRSTFYLHYETVEDLLNESVEYMNSQFSAYMNRNEQNFISDIECSSLDELYLITPEYLEPYLRFIRENKRLFNTAVKNAKALRLDESYNKMFRFVIAPILDRYGVPEQDRRYIMSFYIHGLMSVINEWIKDDCRDSIDYIMSIIQQCVSKN